MATDIERLLGIYAKVQNMKGEFDDQQRDIYILSGVLGGVNLFLIIAVIALVYGIMQVKKQLEDAEIEKQVEAEVNAQKFAAYTGEEMHRKLLAASSPPAVPLNQLAGNPDAEYAFNAPIVDDRIQKTGNGISKNRY